MLSPPSSSKPEPKLLRPSWAKLMVAPTPKKKPLGLIHVPPSAELDRVAVRPHVGRQPAVVDVRGAGERVVEVLLAVELGRQAQTLARRHGEAEAPTSTVRDRVGAAAVLEVGRAAERKPAVGGQLERLVDLLADDHVGDEVGLARRRALVDVAAAGGQLHDAADREGDVVLGVLGQDVELAADVDVAERRAGPGIPHQRVFVDRAAGRVGVEAERTVVAVDARDGLDRQEHLGAVADAVAERADEPPDVAEAGFAIGVHVVSAERLALRGQHLRRRNVPETGVAEERRRRRPRGIRWSWRRGLRRLRLGARGSSASQHHTCSEHRPAPPLHACCRHEYASDVTSRKPRPHPTSRLEGSQRQENEDLAGTRRTTLGVWIRLVRMRWRCRVTRQSRPVSSSRPATR